MNHQDFIALPKSYVLSPAGHGKTYAIVECLRHVEGKSLILTHTHAGVASIKQKIVDHGDGLRASVETISSFAQRYVFAYSDCSNLPEQDNKGYHDAVIGEATDLFGIALVTKTVEDSYSAIFVDEYQDCTVSQHTMLMGLAERLPMHVFGDPLQSIFSNMSESCINLPDDLRNQGFVQGGELRTPHRWQHHGNNAELGQSILDIRNSLLNNTEIDLNALSNTVAEFHFIKTGELENFNPKSRFHRSIVSLLTRPEFDSLLLIIPEYLENRRMGKKIVPVKQGGIDQRAKFKARVDFSNSLQLLEAIDDSSYYATAKTLDLLNEKIVNARKKYKKIKVDCLEKFFKLGDIHKYLRDGGTGDDCLIKKQNKIEADKACKFAVAIDTYLAQPSYDTLANLIWLCKKEMGFKVKRYGLYFTVLDSLMAAQSESISLLEAVKIQRNNLRHYGRSIKGKVLGTTLLTKGLEFDTVAIVDAHKISCKKNLYVALSRGCKKLIVFSNDETLNPS